MSAPVPIRRRFRISAVRRDSGARVTAEELVHALWAGRATLETGLCGGPVEQVVLEGATPADGVVILLRFEGSRVVGLSDQTPAVLAAVATVLQQALGAPVAVSASPEPMADAGKAAAGSTPWTQIAPVLAAIATGVGVIGFVTFVGGAVVWARLKAAGFPAAPALGVFPSQDLLVIGTETLVPQVLVAIVVVVALTLLNFALHRSGMHKRASGLVRKDDEGSGELFVFVVLVLLLSLGWYGFRGYLEPGPFVVACALIGVCASLAAMIASRTSGYAYQAAATFLLVGVFQGYIAFARESSDEHVRGAAVIRDNAKAVAGIFVAEGAGRVYLARVSGEGGTLDNDRARLVGIDKDEVTDVAIADRKDVFAALVQARHLAKELCELQPKAAAPANGGQVENCRTAPPGEEQP